jgi:hypothetical protein
MGQLAGANREFLLRIKELEHGAIAILKNVAGIIPMP